MTIIFMAYHAPIIENGKVITPASLITIEQVNEVDSFGSHVIAKLNQKYARPNKKFEGNSVSFEMFKGKQGIQEVFYCENEIIEYLKALTNDGYLTRRATMHKENELADKIFKDLYSFNMKSAIDKYGMKLSS